MLNGCNGLTPATPNCFGVKGRSCLESGHEQTSTPQDILILIALEIGQGCSTDLFLRYAL